MASIFDFSSTAGSNTTVDGVNISDGMSAKNVDNAIRSLMAIIRQTFSSTLQSFLSGASALGISSGGTGATTAADARTNLGLGSAATESTVPVAKGGTGATTAAGARTNLGAAASTDTIGVGQEWQAVTRAMNTSYQNTTGRPIQIGASFDTDTDATAFQLSTNGSSWVTVAANLRYFGKAQIVVPAGHYYRATGPATITGWAELR